MSGRRVSSSKVRRKQRARLFEEQEGKCFYCGRIMHLATQAGAKAPDTATFEHRVPISRGGSKGYRNIVLACLVCNQTKGNRMETSMLTGAKERERV